MRPSGQLNSPSIPTGQNLKHRTKRQGCPLLRLLLVGSLFVPGALSGSCWGFRWSTLGPEAWG